MPVESIEKLLVHHLKDLYSAEKQILEALPKMAEAATDTELKQAFETHEEQTQEHVRRIETIFEDLEGSPTGKKCKGMEGLVEEGKEIIDEDMSTDGLRDAGLIGAAQKVEHYEIAAYGTAVELAVRLGLDDAAELLQQTLDEESETDDLLTTISRAIMPEAEAAA